MVLPISMEDLELFPKNKHLVLPGSPIAKFLPEEFEQMHNKLSKIWWSRLIISVRGYVVNYVQDDDEKLFFADDAFIIIHRKLVESVNNVVQQFLADLELIVNYPNVVTVLSDLSKAVQPSEQINAGKRTPKAFQVRRRRRLDETVPEEDKKQRWISSAKKSKGIRFEEDPEWQPDDRVVLFQHFFKGNRTWVMTDFDRHIIKVWRPKGSAVIFGDRFIEDKKRLGYSLCSYCGMLEQQIGQFTNHEQQRYCSQKCLEAALATCDNT